MTAKRGIAFSDAMSSTKAFLRSCPFNPFDSYFKMVSALNRAAVNHNGNSRSGWHQQS
jgi:hypothetical protein